jgi:hypothetical protein
MSLNNAAIIARFGDASEMLLRSRQASSPAAPLRADVECQRMLPEMVIWRICRPWLELTTAKILDSRTQRRGAPGRDEAGPGAAVCVSMSLARVPGRRFSRVAPMLPRDLLQRWLVHTPYTREWSSGGPDPGEASPLVVRWIRDVERVFSERTRQAPNSSPCSAHSTGNAFISAGRVIPSCGCHPPEIDSTSRPRFSTGCLPNFRMTQHRYSKPLPCSSIAVQESEERANVC